MKTRKKLAVLLISAIGVLRSTIPTMRGYSISAMVTRATAIRVAHYMLGLFGIPNNNLLFNKNQYIYTNKWPLRLVVRTSGFHPGNRVSITLGATRYYWSMV